MKRVTDDLKRAVVTILSLLALFVAFALCTCAGFDAFKALISSVVISGLIAAFLWKGLE